MLLIEGSSSARYGRSGLPYQGWVLSLANDRQNLDHLLCVINFVEDVLANHTDAPDAFAVSRICFVQAWEFSKFVAGAQDPISDVLGIPKGRVFSQVLKQCPHVFYGGWPPVNLIDPKLKFLNQAAYRTGAC